MTTQFYRVNHMYSVGLVCIGLTTLALTGMQTDKTAIVPREDTRSVFTKMYRYCFSEKSTTTMATVTKKPTPLSLEDINKKLENFLAEIINQKIQSPDSRYPIAVMLGQAMSVYLQELSGSSLFHTIPLSKRVTQLIAEEGFIAKIHTTNLKQCYDHALTTLAEQDRKRTKQDMLESTTLHCYLINLIMEYAREQHCAPWTGARILRGTEADRFATGAKISYTTRTYARVDLPFDFRIGPVISSTPGLFGREIYVHGKDIRGTTETVRAAHPAPVTIRVYLAEENALTGSIQRIAEQQGIATESALLITENTLPATQYLYFVATRDWKQKMPTVALTVQE